MLKKSPWFATHFIEHLSYVGFSEEQKDKIVSFPEISFNKQMTREIILASLVRGDRKCGVQIDRGSQSSWMHPEVSNPLWMGPT